MTVGVDEPPPAVRLLHAEEARRLRLRVGESPVAAQPRVGGSQRSILVAATRRAGPRRSAPCRATSRARTGRARPRGAGRRARRRRGTFSRGGWSAPPASGSRSASPSRTRSPRRPSAARTDPTAPGSTRPASGCPTAAMSFPVAGGWASSDTGIAARSQTPGYGWKSTRLKRSFPSPPPREDPEVDPLRRRRPHLQDEGLVSRPVAREVGRDVGEGDPRPARRLGRVERDRGGQDRLAGLGLGRARRGGQRGQENGRQAQARHGAPPAGVTLRWPAHRSLSMARLDCRSRRRARPRGRGCASTRAARSGPRAPSRRGTGRTGPAPRRRGARSARRARTRCRSRGTSRCTSRSVCRCSSTCWYWSRSHASRRAGSARRS